MVHVGVLNVAFGTVKLTPNHRLEGFMLVAVAVAYTIALVCASRHESAATQREFDEEYGA